jgi:pantoate--beta-alanine ligase
MDTVTTVLGVRERVRSARAAGHRVALVPTMGNLHAGHMSLIELARQHASCCVASVFVNPTQFGPNEDFGRYPRTPAEDSRALAAAGCDLLFMPDAGEMYPNGTQAGTRVQVPALAGILEGEHRPGHFDGVATVVLKLFNIVQPDVAVFGQKDFQQLALIRRMVADLTLPVEIVGAPTVRAADGLALSSRNQYLSEAQRAVAPQLAATLRAAAARIATGETDFAALEQEAVRTLEGHGFRPDYVAIRDAGSLEPPAPSARDLVILTAARLGGTRLIDNLLVSRPGGRPQEHPQDHSKNGRADSEQASQQGSQ